MKKYQVLFKCNRRTVCRVSVLANNENEAATKAENLILLDLCNIEYNKLLLYQKSEVKNMDKLTEMKRLQLISESLECELHMPNRHKDIKRMYALISDMAIASENSDDIKALITTKTALDFLVKVVLK